MHKTELCACLIASFALGQTALGSARAEAFPALELTLYGGGQHPFAREQRGLRPLGVTGGFAGLIRLNGPFAVGGVFEYSRLAWDAAGAADGMNLPGTGFPDPNGNMHQVLLLAAVRWYAMRIGPVQGYAQLGAGYGRLTQSPQHPNCQLENGLGLQLSTGIDVSLHRTWRLGLSAAVQPSAWGLGCDDIFIPGAPPDPPYPGLLLGIRAALTYVWYPP